MSDDTFINYTREAFLHPLNLAGLFGATLSAFFLTDFGLLSQVILSAAFGVELLILGTVPHLPRFRKAMQMRKLKERTKTIEDRAIFKELHPESQKRFLVLKHLSRQIKQNFQKLPYSSQGLLENVSNKIDGLLSNYINMLDLHQRFDKYIHTADEGHIQKLIAEEKAELETIESEKLKVKKRRRLLILTKRMERLAAAQEKYLICETELETIEEAIRYIFEQSMTMSNPEEIGFQLDNLLMEVEETAHIIEDIGDASIDDVSLLSHLDLGDKETASESFSSIPNREKTQS